MKKRSQLLLFAAFILTLIVTVNLAAIDTSAYSKTKNPTFMTASNPAIPFTAVTQQKFSK